MRCFTMDRFSLLIVVLSLLFLFDCSKKDDEETPPSEELPKLIKVTTIGQPGSGPAEFDCTGLDEPWGLDHDGTYLYVADYRNNRIQRFDNNHNYKDWIGVKDGVWGTYTAATIGDNSFIPFRVMPWNNFFFILCDKSGGVKIIKVDKDFNIIKEISLINVPYAISYYPERFVGFNIDSDENFYFYHEYIIYKFDKEGEYVSTFGGKGTSDNKFNTRTAHIEFDKNNVLYICDIGNYSLKKITRYGGTIDNWLFDEETIFSSEPTIYNDKLYYSNGDFSKTLFLELNLNGEVLRKWNADSTSLWSGYFVIKDSLIFTRERFNNYINVYSFN